MSKQAKKGTAKGPVQKAVFDVRKDAERERQRLVGETGTDPLKDEYLKRHLTCKICGYQWVSRKTFPKECPQCTSRRWNTRQKMYYGAPLPAELVYILAMKRTNKPYKP